MAVMSHSRAYHNTGRPYFDYAPDRDSTNRPDSSRAGHLPFGSARDESAERQLLLEWTVVNNAVRDARKELIH
jgi:hypothetical protein